MALTLFQCIGQSKFTKNNAPTTWDAKAWDIKCHARAACGHAIIVQRCMTSTTLRLLLLTGTNYSEFSESCHDH